MTEITQETLLEFPCEFPIKVMGRTQEGFAQLVTQIIHHHAPDFDPAQLQMRTSREGNYLSLTATINATSREQLDALYQELCDSPKITMVL